MDFLNSMAAFGACAGAVMALGLTARRRDAALSVALIVTAWLTGSAYMVLTGDYEAWQISIMLCGGVMLALLKYPPNIWAVPEPDFWRKAIASVLVLQTMWHCVFGARRLLSLPVDVDCYANWITITGWVELLIAGAWSGGHLWRHLYRSWHHPRMVRGYAHHRDAS